MDLKKNHARSRKIAATLVGLWLAAAPAGAARGDWVNWTSFNDVRQVRLIDDTVYFATSGGILAVADPDQAGRRILNTDGLGTPDITDIIVDNAGRKWVTGHGRLIKFDWENSVQYLFRDNDNNLLPLYRVQDEADRLWIGTGIGLVLFSKTLFDGGVEDSYSLFGSLNPSPSVLDILVDGDTIWLATSVGLAVADKSNPAQLKAPAAWTTFDLGGYPELGSESVNSVVTYDNEIYVATPRGVFLLSRAADTAFVPVAIGTNVTFVNIRVDSDSLFYYFDDDGGGGMGIIDGTTAQPLVTTGLPSYPKIGFGDGAVRWVGVATGGIWNDAGGSFARYEHTGLPSNDISDIAVNADGVVTAGFTLTGVAQYDGDAWKLRDVTFREATTNVIVDSSGNFWAGTRGEGLWLITEDTVINYDEQNSTLRGNDQKPPAGLQYVFIKGLAASATNLFASCFIAVNGYPIAVGDFRDLDDISRWDSLGAADGITDVNTVALDYQNGRLAIGTEMLGVFKYYLGPSIRDRSDDSVVHYREGFPNFLISDDIRVVKFAPDGALWVGTNLGLSRYDLAVEFFFDVALPAGIGPEITGIAFDGRGSVWVGSKTGLARLDLISGEQTKFTSLNSGLLSDHVQCLTFDQFSGRLFIGTDAGISYIPSAFGRPTSRVEEVIAFPNPFVVTSAADRLNFNYLGVASLRIFTAAGELVLEAQLTSEGWDGRNQSGEEVASGVYLFVLNDPEGGVGKGKILLVRE
ncbi:MAG: hypothetical protein OEW00_07415 [candidate division Zixibacteria bacterium]|nr:hypothetical protein [candidate division Zixibacteria bacterium]